LLAVDLEGGRGCGEESKESSWCLGWVIGNIEHKLVGRRSNDDADLVSYDGDIARILGVWSDV
jgi:hypothetical protein